MLRADWLLDADLCSILQADPHRAGAGCSTLHVYCSHTSHTVTASYSSSDRHGLNHDYVFVTPVEVDSEGGYMTHDVTRQGHRNKRSLSSCLHYRLSAFGHNMHLDLYPSSVVGPGFTVQTLGSNGIATVMGDEGFHNCLYQGFIRNLTASSAAISTCSGLPLPRIGFFPRGDEGRFESCAATAPSGQVRDRLGSVETEPSAPFILSGISDQTCRLMAVVDTVPHVVAGPSDCRTTGAQPTTSANKLDRLPTTMCLSGLAIIQRLGWATEELRAWHYKRRVAQSSSLVV
ncbi:unnamed protein product [Pleuronectes platessa]|uniref:Peptidase M12B propeptide domain-containing protein n=1 Tax=Pleuronectes platessa TaxID=8262 RepID=A0A9N7YYV7_PLEPL|nr:unnamed protein product [Pleuronectes platessa]